MSEAFISEKLPFLKFEGDQMIYLDGSLGAGFKLKGFDISCASTEAINSFCKKTENFLIGLQEDVKAQVFYQLTNNVMNTVNEHKEVSNGSIDNYKPIQKARLKFFDDKFKEKKFFVPEIYFFLRSAPLQMKKRKLFEKKNTYEGVPEKEFQTHQGKFSIVVNQVYSALRSSGLEPKRLSKEEWFRLCFMYLNLERSENTGVPKLRNE